MIRIEHAHHTRNSRLSSPTSRITGERDTTAGTAMIGTITGHNLLPSRKRTGNLHGVLNRFRSAIRKKESVDITGSDLSQFLAQKRARLGCHVRSHIRHGGKLLGNGLDHPRVPMANIDTHQLAIEIDEAFALRRPEINSFG